MKNDIKKTPLDIWFKSKTGLDPKEGEIKKYQLNKINETLNYVKEKSPFYRHLLNGYAEQPLYSLDDLGKLPFTSAKQIMKFGNKFICVGQEEIARIVTLFTSGTTSEPKRVFFTREDQDLTVDFFSYGIQTFARTGEKVLILMPGERPGSIGALLAEALPRFEIIPLVYGLPHSYEDVLSVIEKERPVNMILAPQTAAAITCLYREKPFESPLKSILLSADIASRSLVKNLSETWCCPVYQHYGMTEMGLGGAVYCSSQEGYHTRSADLYFEVIDPESGVSLPQGEFGEVVFTTLNRRAMPLIRYRTGDWGRISAKKCSCGSDIPVIESIAGRIKDDIHLKSGVINPFLLDEIMFSFNTIGAYQAGILFNDNECCLKLEIFSLKGLTEKTLKQIEKIIGALDVFKAYYENNSLQLDYDIRRTLPVPEILKKKEISLL